MSDAKKVSLVNSGLRYFILALSLSLFLILPKVSFAELSIDSVYPNVSEINQDMDTSIKGGEFSENTKLSLSLDTTNIKDIISTLETGDKARAVEIVNNIAYIANGKSGLIVVNVSNPNSPYIISSLDTPGDAYDIKVLNKTAYIADGESGLQIIDISKPENPSIIGNVDTPDMSFDLSISDSIVYVADRYSGLKIINVQEKKSYKIIGSLEYETGYAKDVIVADQIAYVLKAKNIFNEQKSQLQIIDVSCPSNPKLISSLEMLSPNGFVLKNKTLYIADSYSGLKVLDVSDSSNPKVVNSISSISSATGIVLVQKLAFLTNLENTLQVIDLSDPANPKFLGSVDAQGKILDVFVADQMAWLNSH